MLIQTLIALTFPNGSTVNVSQTPAPQPVVELCLPIRGPQRCQVTAPPDTAHRITVVLTQGTRTATIFLNALESRHVARQALHIASRADTLGPLTFDGLRASLLCDNLSCRAVVNTYIRPGLLPKADLARVSSVFWAMGNQQVVSPWVMP